MGFNRDEDINRPTGALGFSMKDPNILAGVDLEAGGTWLGINVKTGNFAALTNSWLKDISPEKPQSRGYLVSNFLATEFYSFDDLKDSTTTLKKIEKYCENVCEERESYRGFNLLIGNLKLAKFFYVGNTIDKYIEISDGLHSLGNGNFLEQMKKEGLGKSLFKSFVEVVGEERDDQRYLEELKKVMYNQEDFESFSRVTAIQNKWRFIRSDVYWGTKTTTYIFAGQDDRLSIFEQTYKDKDMKEATWEVFEMVSLGKDAEGK